MAVIVGARCRKTLELQQTLERMNHLSRIVSSILTIFTNDDFLTSIANSVPLDCGNSGYERKIHDPTVWRHLQTVYIDTIDDPKYAEEWETFPSYSGFKVAIDVRDDGHRGRGVYAAERIKKGTLVWNEVHTATFLNAQELQNFLRPLEYELQCDVLLWAYVEKETNDVVELALDPASFMNHGEGEEDNNLDVNCAATRDIEIGEELLQDYSSFIGFSDNTRVEWFHQIRGLAWKEHGAPTRSHSTDDYNMLGAPKPLGISTMDNDTEDPNIPIAASPSCDKRQ